MLDDVMQARVAIECQAIRLACERATIADFERLQRALRQIGETIDEADAGGMADFDFHRAIVVASHSETLDGLARFAGDAADAFASQPPRAGAGLPAR